MSDEYYAQAQAIVHKALDLPPDERAACLDACCGDDAALRREVDWLIEASCNTVLDSMPDLITEATAGLERNLRIDVSAQGVYRLIERIGEGGMGVVWLAERKIGGVIQQVALKRLRAGSVAEHARFQEERRILATLAHPNIAHLVDAGNDIHGTPFLAMEYVEGGRIDHWCDAHGKDLRARVAIFMKVCAAVSYAHERLIIHRDLKPANILVDRSGEPKLLDFGIARLLNSDAMLATATRAMTPAYASPEQIDGKPLGTASDVWSLGILLYELLAGSRPFEHLDSDHARATAILSGVVTPPSRLVSRATMQREGCVRGRPAEKPHRIPADLDAIVLKALRRDADQRYASVRELADDLGQFLAARPVEARRGRWIYHARLFVRRNRWVLAAGIGLFAVVAGFTWRTILAEREARLQAEVAERTTEFLMSAFSLSDPTQAERSDFTAREILDRGRDRIDEELAGQPRVRARLLEALGNAYRGINEGHAGTPLLEAAAQLYLDPAVNNPMGAARSLRAQALGLLASRGSTQEAESAAQRAFDLLIRHANGEDLVLADGYGTLALMLNLNGKENQAIEAARKALALREAGNADAFSLARSYADLCAVVAGTGEYAQALPHCMQARALHAKAGTTRTSDYRIVLRELEGLQRYIGDRQGAIRVARERVAQTRELFGEDSSALATERVAFAGSLVAWGLYEESATLLDEGIPVILRHNGASSIQYARALFNAGLLEHGRGEFDKAEELLRESHAIYGAAVGENDRHLLQVVRVVLASTLIVSGRANPEARGLLESVMAVRAKSDVPDVSLAYARLPLAQWHVMHEEYAEAERLLDQVEAVGKRVELEMHAQSAATRASILRARGDAEGALRLHRSAYEITLRNSEAAHPQTAVYALTYARALREAGKAAAAGMLESEFQPRLEAAFPPTSAHRQLLTVH